MAEEDIFKGIGEDENAFGIIPNAGPGEPEGEPKGEPEGEPAKEPEGEPEGEQTPQEEGEKQEEQQKADDLIKVIEDKAPALAELIKKKGYKNLDDVAKTYGEPEKELSRKSQKLSDLRKLTEKYVKFDGEGNILGFTDEGKSLTAPASQPQTVASPANAPQETLQELNDKFLEAYENNPVETLTKIITTIVDFKSKSMGAPEQLKTLESKISPILQEYEERQRLKLIDEVAEGRVKQGDEKAQEFIDEYADEIAQELGKIDAELKKVNPKLALNQAYLIVKDKKIREFQEKLKEKQKKEIEKEQAGANVGASSGGGAEETVPDVIKEMEDAANSKPNSAFFGI